MRIKIIANYSAINELISEGLSIMSKNPNYEFNKSIGAPNGITSIVTIVFAALLGTYLIARGYLARGSYALLRFFFCKRAEKSPQTL